MSSTIDERIVEMQFNNQRFEQNVSTSISTLDKLKSALKLDSATNGLSAIEKGFDKLNLSGVGSAVETIASRFSTLGIIGTTILQDIGHKAFEAGQKILGMVKSMTIDQVSSGWAKYADKTTSVQTIMAATGQTWEDDANALMQLNALTEQGFDPKQASTYLSTWKQVNSGMISTWQAAKSLGITVQEFNEKTANFGEISGITYAGSQMDYVNSQMEKLNWFTDETSYAFTDMVNNIGKFTANNIPLSQATTAMQGIANWAAISGQNAGTASRAMYNMAQAIGVGSVKLMDWKSIENANMATAEFKQQALEAAAAAGTLKVSYDRTGKAIYKTTSGMEVTTQNFSQTLASGWFTSDVLLSTLDKYGGFTDKLYDFSEATGLTATEILELVDAQEAGSISEEKYQNIAAETGLSLEEVKESLSDLASEENEFGRKAFKAAQEAKTFQDAIDATKDAASTKWMNIFENIFGDYEKAKGIWTGFANFLYDTLVAPLEKLEEVSEILGELNAVTRIARGFSYLFSIFKGDGETTFGILGALRDGFQRVFPPVDNLKLAISKVLSGFTQWAKKVSSGNLHLSDIREATAGVATVLKAFFATLSNVWAATEPLRSALSGLISAVLSFVSTVFRAAKYIDTTGLKFDWLNKISEKLAGVIEKVSKKLKSIKTVDVVNAFTKLGSILNVIKQSFINIWNATEPLRTSLVGLGEAIWGLVGRLFESGDGFELTEYKAEGLSNICQKLSEIIDKVSEAINGLSVEKIRAGFAKVAEIVNKVKTAFNNFINAIRNFSLGNTIGKVIDWIKEKFEGLKEFLSKFSIGKMLMGGAAVGGGAVIGLGIIKLIKLIKNPLKALDGIKEKISGLLDSLGDLAGLKIDSALTGLQKFAATILMLAAALLILGFVDYEKAIVGLGLIALTISGFIANLKVFEKIKASTIAKVAATMIALSASMLIFSVALIALAAAVAAFALVAKMKTIWKGLAVMAASLAILAVAMWALSKISPKVFIGAAALLVLSAALIVLAGAVALFTLVAKMDGLKEGLGLMAMTLGILAIALIALAAAGPSAIAGAAALIIVSVALLILAGAVAAFTAVASMDNAGAGFLLLAGMIIVLTLALAALSPVALGALGAAAALLVISVACLVLAAAVGIVALVLPKLGEGLQLLAEGVAAGLEALGGGIAAFGAGVAILIQEVADAIALGIENILLSIGTGLGGAISAIGTGIGEGLAAAGAGIGQALQSISLAIGFGLIYISIGITALGAGIGQAIAAVGSGIGEGLAAIGEGIGLAIAGIASGISTGLSDLGAGISEFGAGIGEAISSIGTGVGEALSAVGEGISSIISGIATGISSGLISIGFGISLLGAGIASSITSISGAISTALSDLGSGISSFGDGTAELITSVLGAVALGVEEVVASVGKGIADGITAISNSVTDLGTGLGDLGTGITGFGDSMKSLNGIAWFDIGNGFREIASAIKTLKIGKLDETVNTASEGIVRACTEMSTAIQTALNDTFTLIDSGGETIVTNAANGIKSKLSSVRSAGISIGQNAVSGMRSGSGTAFSTGRFAAQGFIDGFLSKELEAKIAGGKIAKKAVEGAQEELDSHSPSRVFFKLGNFAGQGFINGLSAMEDSVEDAGVSISRAALSSVVDTMAGISEILEENPEFYPTIRPVLDSKAVESGLSRLGAIGASSYMDARLNAQQDLSEIQNGSRLLASALANVNSNQEYRELSQFTPKDAEEFIAIGNRIINYLKDGHDLYFDDGAFAGRINRRLGSV